MYKKPPDENRTREYPEITYPAQRRKRPDATYKQPSNAFHADEHPEIPRVRRASLNLDKQPTNPSPGSEFIQDVDDDDEDVISQNITRTDKIAVTANRRSSSSTVYSPPSSSRHLHRAKSPAGSRHLHSQSLFLTRLQQLSQSRIFMTCCVIALIIISAQIVVNLNHNHTRITLSSWGNTNTKQPPAIGQIPASAHKLVIVPQDIDHPAPPVIATSAYLLDADTGTTLYAYNPFLHLPMLSTTKLMTASLAVEQGNLDRRITITNAMSNDISQLSADSALFGIKKGDSFRAALFIELT